MGRGREGAEWGGRGVGCPDSRVTQMSGETYEW